MWCSHTKERSTKQIKIKKSLEELEETRQDVQEILGNLLPKSSGKQKIIREKSV